MIRLGINIDHIATIRQARRTIEPDPVWGAALAELGGADLITVHLREDRRHIQDRDVRILCQTVQVPLNLEMAVSSEILEIALECKPHQVTLVPEKREEVTTEGGLDVVAHCDRVRQVVNRLKHAGIHVSLFIDPDPIQVDMSYNLGVPAIEFHSGGFADAFGTDREMEEFERLRNAILYARERNLHIHVGHGLTYRNVTKIAGIEGVEELNIGHSVVARAVLVGLDRAVREMKELIAEPEIRRAGSKH